MVALLLAFGPGGTARADHGRDAADRGPIGVRLLEAPAARRHDPRAEMYIVDHAAPGTTIKRRIQVTSSLPTRQHIALYAAAAGIERARFTFAAGSTANELTRWTSLDHATLDLAPHGSAVAHVVIHVPPKASPGERYAVIWAQDAAMPDPSHNISAINRVGIRVYLSVGPGGEPLSYFQIGKVTSLRDQTERPQLQVQVHNTGARALDMNGTLSLSGGPGGLSVGPFPATTGVTLAPGDTAPTTVLLNKQIPEGPWKARLTLASGLVQQTVTFTITFPRSGVGKAVVDAHGPIPLAMAGLALMTFAAGFIILRRTRIRPTLLRP
jgi:hypothetical protein